MTRRQGRAPLSRMLGGSGTSGHVPSAAGAAVMRSRTHRPALHSGRTRPWTGRPASCSRRCCGSKTAVAQRRARAPTGRGAAASARTGAVGGGRSPGDGGASPSSVPARSRRHLPARSRSWRVRGGAGDAGGAAAPGFRFPRWPPTAGPAPLPSPPGRAGGRAPPQRTPAVGKLRGNSG